MCFDNSFTVTHSNELYHYKSLINIENAGIVKINSSANGDLIEMKVNKYVYVANMLIVLLLLRMRPVRPVTT